MYIKAKIKPVRIPTRPSALQQFKAEVGDDILTKDETKILQQKYGITEAEILFSEKLLIQKEEAIGGVRRSARIY